jgi:hypothetical protein
MIVVSDERLVCGLTHSANLEVILLFLLLFSLECIIGDNLAKMVSDFVS